MGKIFSVENKISPPKCKSKQLKSAVNFNKRKPIGSCLVLTQRNLNYRRRGGLNFELSNWLFFTDKILFSFWNVNFLTLANFHCLYFQKLLQLCCNLTLGRSYFPEYSGKSEFIFRNIPENKKLYSGIVRKIRSYIPE